MFGDGLGYVVGLLSSSILFQTFFPLMGLFVLPWCCVWPEKPVRQDGGLVAKFKFSWPFGHAMFDFAFYDLDSLRDVWSIYNHLLHFFVPVSCLHRLDQLSSVSAQEFC